MLHSEDLATDPTDVEQGAEVFFSHDIDTLVETLLVLGQLDPTEIDLKTGTPRWTPGQATVILKANTLLGEWRE